MQSLDELFEHELQNMLGAEQTVASALEQLSQCQTDPQLQQVFSTHLAETQNHIDRLEQVCSMVGAQPMATTDEGAKGLVREHDHFVAEALPDSQVHAVFDAGAGQKVEQYEITAYRQLAAMADSLGYRQAAQLIRTNLDEERQQFQRLQQVTESLGLSQQPAQGQSQQQMQVGQTQQTQSQQPQQMQGQQPQQAQQFPRRGQMSGGQRPPQQTGGQQWGGGQSQQRRQPQFGQQQTGGRQQPQQQGGTQGQQPLPQQ